MPKKTKNEYKKEEFFLAVYRWEFLRRNKDYIKDFIKSQKTLENISRKIRTPAQRKKNSRSVKRSLEKLSNYFILTYGINSPESPDFSALQLLMGFNKDKENTSSELTYKDIEKFFRKYKAAKIKVENMGWLPHGVSCLTPVDRERVNSKGQSIFVPLTDEEVKRQNFIRVEINLDVRKERLIPALEEIINKWQEERRRVINKKESRIRLRNYEEYLKVWDLHQQEKTIQEIARSVYPNQYKIPTSNSGKTESHYDLNENLLSKVRKQLEAAKEIIEGQFRKIK